MSSTIVINTEAMIEELQQVTTGKVSTSMTGKDVTTFKIGGPLQIFVEPVNEQEVLQVILYAKRMGLPIHSLGNGSNTLILDGGLDGIVLSLKKLKKFEQDGEDLIVGSGEMLPALSVKCAKLGLSGLEWSNGIPGSVGGSVVMNAGAFGGMMMDVVEEVYGFDQEGNRVIFKNHELKFNYRESLLQNNKIIVTAVKFNLKKDDPEKIKTTIKKIAAIRDATQPKGKKCAGSILAIPNIYDLGNNNLRWKLTRSSYFLRKKHGMFIPYIIKKYNLPQSVGDAVLEHDNFNWISNKDAAKASDILQLSNQIKGVLEEKLGIKLRYEMRIVGKK